MKEKRKEYEEKFDAALDEWDTQTALLKARADKATAEANIEYYKTIQALQLKQVEAREKLKELKSAGDDAWDDLTIGAEKVWADVKNAFNDAISGFK